MRTQECPYTDGSNGCLSYDKIYPIFNCVVLGARGFMSGEDVERAMTRTNQAQLPLARVYEKCIMCANRVMDAH
jgi:hypothetical protein